MNDLKLDTSSHDLVIENGDLKLLNLEQEVSRQSLKINLLFFKGEWFLNTEYGVPYFQSILRKGTSKDLVDNIIRAKILQSYQITNITEFKSVVRNNQYVITIFRATTLGGEIISIEDQVIVEEIN